MKSQCIFDSTGKACKHAPQLEWHLCIKCGRYSEGLPGLPVHRACLVNGPGSYSTWLLSTIGLTPARWARLVSLFRDIPQTRECMSCVRRSMAMDRWWYTSKLTSPARTWLRNSASNVQWIKRLIK